MARKSRFRKGSAPGGPSAPVRRDLDTLIQGVSQQPPHLRTAGQGQEQLNGWSSPVEGLSKRNCVRLQAKVSDDELTNFYMEMMDITNAERYSCLIRPGTNQTIMELHKNGVVPTIDIHGTGLSLNAERHVIADTTSYIYNAVEAGTSDYYKQYVLISSGSIGLLLNREKETAYSSDKTPKQTGQGIVFIRAVAYNVTYTVKIDGTQVASFTTPTADSDANELSSTDVANALKAGIDAKSGYTAVTEQYVIHVKKDDGKTFKLSVDDGRSGELANAFTDTVNDLSQLPILCVNDYVVEVEGDPSTATDNRWLKFKTNTDGDEFGEGGWSETVKPGIQYKFDPNTMPLVIYREADNVFFIGPADGAERKIVGNGTDAEPQYSFTFPKWGERTAGDEETSPDPEFIGKIIKDHAIFRSRYVIAAGETVQLSETNDIFNFFNDTSLLTQSTDPFGLRGTSERSSPLEWMIIIEDSILAFSATTQFQIRAADADVLTPLTGEIFRLSNLDMNPNVRPKLSGSQVLFATQYFGYTHFREFNFYNNTRNTKVGLNLGSSLDVTNYVPKYIEGYITHWDVGQAVDACVAISPTDNTELYVYKYLWQVTEQGQKKLQRSWSKWKLNQSIRWVQFIDNALYMLVTDATGTYFVLQLNDEIELRTEPQIHLDRLVQFPAPAFTAPSARVTGTYDSSTDRTTFTLPYTPREKTLGVVRFTNETRQGLKIGETTTTSMVCSEAGDWTGFELAFGEPYDFEYVFNTAYVPDKNEAETRRMGQLAGRTQILRWTVNHVDTGMYKVRVRRFNRTDDTVKTFRSRRTAVNNSYIGYSNDWLENGSIDVPVCSQNTLCQVSVESDSWLPLTITSASWKGVYSDREKAI